MSYRYFLVLAILSGSALGQTVEHDLVLPQDSSSKNALAVNPAIPDPDQHYLHYLQTQRQRKTEFKILNNNVPAKVKQDTKTTDHYFSLMTPVGGGAAVGIVAQVLGQDHTTDFENETGLTDESFRKQYVALRLTTKVVDKLRFGMDLRYSTVANDIAGGFFINDDDRTRYKGTMTGFAVGLLYLDQLTRLGTSYTPPMRGKAKVEGEEIIITESGFVDVDIGYGKDKDWFVGFNVRRWLHNRDDRAKTQESPVDQRRISYNGLHLEQFLLPTMRYGLGVDTPYWQDFYLRANIAHNEYSFLFEENQVPGDNDQLETKVKSYSAKVVSVYQPSDFAIHLGYSYETRKSADINDTEGWFAGRYLDYKSTDKYFFAMFAYHP